MKWPPKKWRAHLQSVDSEFGRTTDPVRMYMREMGSVELLSREGEIAIAKRIEEGMNQMLTTLANQPQMIAEVLADYDRVEKGEMRLSDIISGYIEPIDLSTVKKMQKKQLLRYCPAEEEEEEEGRRRSRR